MKRILIISLFFISFGVYSQNNIYLVKYKLGKYHENDESKDNLTINRNEILTNLKLARQKMEFELYCNNKTSVFLLKKQLSLQENNDFFQIYAKTYGVGSDDEYYKSYNTKKKIKKYNYLGTTFLIESKFNQYEWIVTNETKIINGYKCYKAITEYTEYSYRSKGNIIYNISAWFTYEIPLPFGPKGLDGLPGLVLEASFNDKIFFYATTIERKSLKNIKLFKEPKKGKHVNIDQFLEYVNKISKRNY